jgi:regulator of Ty1 transposition protein 103
MLTQSEIDQARATTRKAIGGSIFSNSSSSLPPNIQPIFTASNTLSTAESRASAAVGLFDESDEKVSLDRKAQSIPLGELPALSADVTSLLQKLANASVTVAATIDARQILLSALAKLTAETKASLKEDEGRLAEFASKKSRLETYKQDIEDRIQRGEDGGNGVGNGAGDEGMEPLRPDAEPLTPPAIESLTPPGEPENDDEYAPPVASVSPPDYSTSEAGMNIFAKVIASNVRSASDSSLSGQLPAKRRKLDVKSEDEFAAFAGDQGALGELDPEVEAMLS